jgi:hypothetical protein
MKKHVEQIFRANKFRADDHDPLNSRFLQNSANINHHNLGGKNPDHFEELSEKEKNNLLFIR